MLRGRSLVRCAVLSAALLLMQGCATQSEVQIASAPPVAGKAVPIRLEACTDRTGTKERDLAAEATRLITERLNKSTHFELRDDAPFVVTCEVTQYVEGSAVKRWIMPGWGSTVGQIALMVSSAKDQSVIAIIQGNVTVSGGGLYTIGAENYILASAADDVIAKLRAWAVDPGAVEKR